MTATEPDTDALALVDEGVLPLPRAARFCGIGVDEMRELLTAGVLPHTRHNRLILVPRVAIKRYLAASLRDKLVPLPTARKKS